MKSSFTKSIIIIFWLILLCTIVPAQIDMSIFTNPVPGPESVASWDDHFISASSVIYDSTTSTYKMWFTGGQGPWDGGIGYATSTDGKIWTKYENNPVLQEGQNDTWDDYFVAAPSVVVHDNTYHMWYCGGSDQTISHINIGYATSSDGITWQKHESNPVLEFGPAGSWEETWIYFPYVLYDGSNFNMWYTGTEGNPQTLAGWAERIGHAMSPDGITWTKDANNPVLNLGIAGNWDDNLLATCSVIHTDSIYQMWYTGSKNSNNFKIGYATSPDGVIWSKYANNPVLVAGSSGAWDYPRVQDPRVILIDSTYHMWYSGGGYFTWQIGYASSLDGINWTKEPQPVLTDIDNLDPDLPMFFSLSQNYPNPFNPTTVISYQLPVTSQIDLSLYNLLGQKVATLVSEKQPPGNYQVTWDASEYASGVYIYQIKADNFIQSKKMLLLR